MIGGHKVWGQGRWSRSGVKVMGSRSGSCLVVTRSGVKVGGQGQGGQVGRGLRSRSGSWLWSRSGVKVVVKVGGHDRWSQGRGSRSGVKVVGSRSGS